MVAGVADDESFVVEPHAAWRIHLVGRWHGVGQRESPGRFGSHPQQRCGATGNVEIGGIATGSGSARDGRTCSDVVTTSVATGPNPDVARLDACRDRRELCSGGGDALAGGGLELDPVPGHTMMPSSIIPPSRVIP